MRIFERLFFQPRGGMFREFYGVKALLTTSNTDLYRQLLPEPLSMPDQPVIMILFIKHFKVAPWYMPSYHEAAISLRCAWKGIEGWHVATMPVTRWLPMVAGRTLGFPKYISEKISIKKVRANWEAYVQHKGQVTLALEFQPGMNRQVAPWAREQLRDEAFVSGCQHLLVPAGRGPRVQTIQLVHQVPPRWKPVIGQAHINIAPGEPWAKLFPEEIYVPGASNHFTGGFNLVVVKT